MPSNTQEPDPVAALQEQRRYHEDKIDRIDRALAALGEKSSGRPGRRPGRPRGSGTKSAGNAGGAPRRRRRRRGGTRADQAVKLVEGNPGISASEVAKQMKIKPNYLYRVLGELEKEGRVTKKGREYHPTGK
ncbi:MAG TPA: hypothetical protein VGB06_04400 [Solirubrobacterales bacterium]